MTTDKTEITHLAEILYRKGLRTAIISPGSRNAPLVMAFNRHKGIECLSIIDERSAAFFALGMAQQSCIPVVIISTSGTAALNYAPAIAEAFYQEIPLIILTADRPVEFIDQAEGQAIRQKGIFANYIKKSFELPQQIYSSDDLWYNDRIVSESFNLATTGRPGPVHINVPFREPLYGVAEAHNKNIKIIEQVSTSRQPSQPILEKLISTWNSYQKKMIVSGMLKPDIELNHELNMISSDNSLVVLTETTSNLNGKNFFPCIDKILSSFDDNEAGEFAPRLLVTIGSHVISKMLKSFLRNHTPIEHWHIEASGLAPDTYQSLTKIIQQNPADFFKIINESKINTDSNFRELWQKRDIDNENLHAKYLSNLPFSDLKVYEQILKAVPEFSNLQMANSAGVRYVQLFRPFKQLSYNANRGTSGIDGCTSTGAGAAHFSKIPTTLVTGDIAFLYDSNALWNKHLPDNLKIIIVNNSGGGIFRFISGPSGVEELEEYFETKHDITVKYIAKNFNVDYLFCDKPNELNDCLKWLYKNTKKTAILEIKTPAKESAEILKSYFKFMKRKI
ncbi:MAG: 2-succinyl-5-enolpyruvyl-6-hydroxy-3-cyclohexene-1-carboxylic-acid synthase [Bacteroidota bacterium]|nr:2-succinyl-5-enolpyruvyl-6-hydroxy-3-cyclohexene-1-carboxylic-acid synthase [Bacteroidota bacterium]